MYPSVFPAVVDPTLALYERLGLNLVKRIAKAHGGDVTVKSAPGHGARFTLSLPRAS